MVLQHCCKNVKHAEAGLWLWVSPELQGRISCEVWTRLNTHTQGLALGKPKASSTDLEARAMITFLYFLQLGPIALLVHVHAQQKQAEFTI